MAPKRGNNAGGGAQQDKQVALNVNTIMTDKLQLPVPTQKQFDCVRSYNAQGWSVADGLTPRVSTFAFVPATHIGDFSSLASVFDQYRINRVEFWLRPDTNATVPAGAAAAQMCAVIDYDDALVLGSMSDAQSYSNQVTVSAYQPLRRCFNPRIARAVYNGTFTGYENAPAPWIDMNSGSVQHYGVKTFWPTSPVGFSYDMEVRAWCSFRASR